MGTMTALSSQVEVQVAVTTLVETTPAVTIPAVTTLEVITTRVMRQMVQNTT